MVAQTLEDLKVLRDRQSVEMLTTLLLVSDNTVIEAKNQFVLSST